MKDQRIKGILQQMIHASRRGEKLNCRRRGVLWKFSGVLSVLSDAWRLDDLVLALDYWPSRLMFLKTPFTDD